MLKEVPFYFVRHGETDWNLNRKAQGQIDIPLNATGIEQARAAAEIVRGLGIRSICSSPLSRAYETARHACDAAGCTITLVDELMECNLGADEGRDGGDWFMDWREGRYLPDGAEVYEDFLSRALRGVNKALEAEGPVLVVAHGGVFWSVLRHARIDSIPYAMNGQVMRLDPPGGERTHWHAEALTGAAIPLRPSSETRS
ncbi:MAG: histidine phosphatase family protein [Parvibaculum sp.]|uniref:histidine phosphatase family protein n=1 Tax=Parvibaculum sp. TaxID=2024848 RepID=UPI002717F724|nr:histidine phosphatase family protein [Parvibaculum sp.]MDO8838403.1 histidine phosphatase family protein [Parvibaculum sp.]